MAVQTPTTVSFPLEDAKPWLESIEIERKGRTVTLWIKKTNGYSYGSVEIPVSQFFGAIESLSRSRTSRTCRWLFLDRRVEVTSREGPIRCS